MKTERKPHLIKKHTDMKCQRVEGSVVPGLEEATQVGHLLAEPKSEHVSVDRVLCFGKENLEKHLKMEDFFSCALDYSWRINCGGLHGQGGDDLKLEVLDGLLDEVDEADDIQAAHDLSGACEDFQLDIEFPEKYSESDCAPHEESNLHNLTSQSHAPGFSGTRSSAVGTLESSIATIRESNSKNGVLEKMVGCDLHHTFKRKFGCQAPVTNTIRSIIEHKQNTTRSIIEHKQSFDESDDDEKPLVSFIFSTKSVKSTVEVTKGGSLLRQKRLRKPTNRYIEEFSRNSTTGKNKRLKVGSQGELPQVASELQRRRGHPKKIVPKLELESDCELSASESEDEHKRSKRSKMACDRRKHQRMWTLAEVIKLVDGIAQYGVGRWTDIKRLLFASSAYRTPVDLRDKWRNLLRSSSAHKHNRRECETKPKHVVRPLPMPLVCRIHELATIHPYPMARSPKKPSDRYVPSSKQPRTTEAAPSHSPGRKLRRKKCR
ncbi:TRF-like 8 [Hibiscus trionum]|uniref:TRF-like 8 n=1 Tax=Hibiscus trionum TaxID=183268 RepID=A0A9W7HZF0_HIBTR|nr:TRF-like 8 [Hibiscus trionum]